MIDFPTALTGMLAVTVTMTDPAMLLLYAILIACALWQVYMMTFRTADYLAIKKAGHEKKERQRRQANAAAHLGFGLLKMFMRK